MSKDSGSGDGFLCEAFSDLTSNMVAAELGAFVNNVVLLGWASAVGAISPPMAAVVVGLAGVFGITKATAHKLRKESANRVAEDLQRLLARQDTIKQLLSKIAEGEVGVTFDWFTQEELAERCRAHLAGDFQNLASEIKKLRPLVLPPQTVHQIRPPRGDFTGREEELGKLRKEIGEKGANISGLQGLGGVGKTELAVKLVEELGGGYPDGQFFVDLKGTADPAKGERPLTAAEALAQVVRCYYPPETKLPDEQEQLEKMYQSVLHGKKAIVLADNARTAEQLRPLIPPAGCLLLVTSRWHFALPGPFPLRLDSLLEADAVELLLRICKRIGGHAKEIARLCGRLPLALRAAGSLLAVRKDIAVEEYARDLADERTRLERIGAEGVEMGVEASLGLSYRLLGAEAARAFRGLAVFPGTFDAAAEEYVCGDDGHKQLGELFRYSLVEFDESSRRWRLHDLARDFAAGRLREAREVETAGLRHAEHYLRVLRPAKGFYKAGGKGITKGLALFDLEWPNIEAGFGWARAKAAGDDGAARLCNQYPDAAMYGLALRRHPREWTAWLATALAAAQRLKDRAAEGVHVGNLGNAYAAVGQPLKAVEYYNQSLTIARQLCDRRGEGNALGNLGNVHRDLGKTREAIKHYEQHLAIVREIGDRGGEGAALGNLGLAYADLGETCKAIEHYEQHLAIAREIGDRQGEGNALGNLGIAYKNLGEVRKAIGYYEQQLAITREIGDRRGEGNALGNLGNAYARLGEVRKAIEYYEQALAIDREIGDRRGEGQDLGNLGVAYRNLGEVRKAVEYYEQHLAIAREIGDRRGEGAASWNKALALDKLGRRQEAIELAEAALKIRREIEDPNTAKVERQLEEWRKK